ncbi:MAG: hypothetical protein HC897_03575 [Thermoanaerobaculia bacterium]|nr:hypothetical protein [Thermoanaerobaculia bacterium]
MCFFSATDNLWGRDLWVSDGTPEGTHSLRKGKARDTILLGVSGGKLYFQADDPALGWEPWVSDGTTAGTHMVRDVCPGVCSSLPSPPCANGCPFEPAPSVGYRGKFFFVADDDEHGRELWISDGTETGTLLMADLCEGSCSSAPNSLAVFRDALYFLADDGVHGEEVWRSDGTTGGTMLFAELRPGPLDDSPGWIVPVADRFFYVLGSGCGQPLCAWRSDGTATGTRLTHELFPDGFHHFLTDLVVAGTNVFWLESFEESLDAALWGSASSAVGFQRLLLARATSLLAALPDGRVFLRIEEDDGSPAELWVSDGTAAGTQRIAAANPAFSHDATRASAAVLGDQIVFVTGAHQEPRSLWVSDGSAAGTRKIADVSATGTSSSPQRLASRGEQLFFNASTANSFPLWASDGSAAGTTILSEPLRPQHWIALGDRLVFNTGTRQGGVLGVTDGTAAGTSRFDADFNVRGAMAVLGEQVFSAAGATGQQLWASDGTEAGTRLIRTVSGASGPFPELPGSLTPLGSNLLFIAFDGPETPRLWRSDGTPSGTIPIKTFSPCQGCLEPTAAPPRSHRAG